MLKVCVAVDVEGFISFKRKNPEWNWLENLKMKVNGFLAPLKYDRKGFDKIYNLAVRERFPISLMLVGSIFRPKQKHNFIDYGYHSWGHFPLTYIKDKRMNEEIKNIYNAKSFSAPMYLIEDPIAPGRVLKALKEQGYRICVWAGPTIRDDKGTLVIIKEPRKKITKPVKNHIKCVYVSSFFEGNSSKEHMRKIIAEIEKNSKKDAIYCITTHDFAHKKLKNFKFLINSLKEMQLKNKIKIVNLKQIK